MAGMRFLPLQRGVELAERFGEPPAMGNRNLDRQKASLKNYKEGEKTK